MRKNKKIYSILSLVLMLAFVTQAAGCSMFSSNQSEAVVIEDMELEDVYTYSFDFIGGTDVMPIVGYHGPYETSYEYNGNEFPDFLSDEMFQLLKDSGINSISASNINYMTRKDSTIRLLEQGEKYGIGITVRDSRIIGEGGDSLSLETIDSMINEYSNYPAFIMCYLHDEPYYSEFNGTKDGINIEDFSYVAQAMDSLGYSGYGNLFPMIVGSEQGYEAYVRAMAQEWKMDFLSYDYYPFGDNSGLKNAHTWFKNMAIVKKVADEEGIPFWTFAEAGAEHNDAQDYFDSTEYFPSQGEFLWSISTSLAFGAKGIQYFPLVQPYYYAYALSEPHDFQRNGIIGAYGNTTRWYYYAQVANAQIAAVDQVLMNSVNKGVIASGEAVVSDLEGIEYLLEGTAWRELADVQGDALIGCFNYRGKTALYVVNYDTEYAQNITLNFQDTYDITVIQDAEESHLSRKNLELTLSAGNGALIVFE